VKNTEGLGYTDLLKRHRPEMLYGTVFNFFSNFGQTFFISLLLPGMALAAGIAYEEAGYLYSMATLTSAALLALLGKWSDRLSSRAYGIICCSLFTVGCGLALGSSHLLLLAASILLIRWAGQGLLSHASTTAMAKQFPQRPAAAFALTSLGFPIGESILPIMATALISSGHHQWVWGLVLASSCLVLLPLAILGSRGFRAVPAAETTSTHRSLAGKNRVWRDPRLWVLLPHLVSLGFVMTAILFFSSILLKTKGWDIWWLATGLTCFALTRAFFTMGIGSWFKSRDALPMLVVTKLPLLIGCGLLLIPEAGAWMLIIFFLLAGSSQGIQMVISRTALTELYGPAIIGTAKSATTSLVILSTALAPAIYSWAGQADDTHLTHVVLWGNLALMAFATIFTQCLMPWLKRQSQLHAETVLDSDAHSR